MELTRWEPGRLVGDLLDEVWASPFGMRQPVRLFEADIVELGDEIRVTAELPGVTGANLDLTLENNVLTISGEKKDERAAAEEDGRYHLMERRWGRFSRSFALPVSVNQDEVAATFKDGILTVRIPKAESSRRRRIQIGTGNGEKRLSGTT